MCLRHEQAQDKQLLSQLVRFLGSLLGGGAMGGTWLLPWLVELSSYGDSRGEEITAVGKGFKNGTTVRFWRDADMDGQPQARRAHPPQPVDHRRGAADRRRLGRTLTGARVGEIKDPPGDGFRILGGLGHAEHMGNGNGALVQQVDFTGGGLRIG